MAEVISAKFEWRGTEALLHSLNLQRGGKVQQAIDNAVVRYSDPYVPYRTGRLANSAFTQSQIGNGKIVYNAPYARKVYYDPTCRFNRQVHPLAGGYWFERMKAEHTQDILREAANATGK